jgi:hypothetical protein
MKSYVLAIVVIDEVACLDQSNHRLVLFWPITYQPTKCIYVMYCGSALPNWSCLEVSRGDRPLVEDVREGPPFDNTMNRLSDSF